MEWICTFIPFVLLFGWTLDIGGHEYEFGNQPRSVYASKNFANIFGCSIDFVVLHAFVEGLFKH